MYTWVAEVIPNGSCDRLQVACLCQSHYRQLFHSFCPVHCIPPKSLPIYELSTMSIVGQKGQKNLKEDFGTALQTNYLRQKVKSRQSLSNQIIRSSNYLVGLNSAQTKKYLNAISYWYQRIGRLPRIVGHPHMGRLIGLNSAQTTKYLNAITDIKELGASKDSWSSSHG